MADQPTWSLHARMQAQRKSDHREVVVELYDDVTDWQSTLDDLSDEMLQHINRTQEHRLLKIEITIERNR